MDLNQQAEHLVHTYADAILRLSYTYLKIRMTLRMSVKPSLSSCWQNPAPLKALSRNGPMCCAWLPTPARIC